jgi:hypothetical protein
MDRDKQVLLNMRLKRFRNMADDYILEKVSEITRYLMKYERFIYEIKYNGRYENEYITQCILRDSEIYFLWDSYGKQYNANMYVNEHTLKSFVDWLLEDCEDKSLVEYKPELLIRKGKR